METTGYIALSRQMVMRQNMNVIANNLANMNTAGYQGERMLFVEHLTKTDDGKLISFVQDLALIRDLQPGPTSVSDNPLDIAIRGEGYFSVETPGGERFTRRGTFTLDNTGQLVTPEGYPVLGTGDTPIVIPPDSASITVARDGTVSTEAGELGRLQLVTFDNEQLLSKNEDGLYEIGDAERDFVRDPHVEQGMVEGSNVKGVVEITHMMNTVRSYQSANKLAEDEHERQRRAIEHLVTA